MDDTQRRKRVEDHHAASARGAVNTVSIMVFEGDEVVRGTLYFADPFDPPEWRSQWAVVVPQE
jgi:hypothetical protein